MNTAEAHIFAEQNKLIEHQKAIIASMHEEIGRAKTFPTKPEPRSKTTEIQAAITSVETLIRQYKKGQTQ